MHENWDLFTLHINARQHTEIQDWRATSILPLSHGDTMCNSKHCLHRVQQGRSNTEYPLMRTCISHKEYSQAKGSVPKEPLSERTLYEMGAEVHFLSFVLLYSQKSLHDISQLLRAFNSHQRKGTLNLAHWGKIRQSWTCWSSWVSLCIRNTSSHFSLVYFVSDMSNTCLSFWGQPSTAPGQWRRAPHGKSNHLSMYAMTDPYSFM